MSPVADTPRAVPAAWVAKDGSEASDRSNSRGGAPGEGRLLGPPGDDGPQDVETALASLGASPNNGRQLAPNMKHVVWNALTNAQQSVQLDAILRPMCHLFMCLGIGPVDPWRFSGRVDPADGEDSSQKSAGMKRKFRRSPLRGLAAVLAWAVFALMCLNSVRGLSVLGKIGSKGFPWVLGLCWLLWWIMNTLKAAQIFYAGGFRVMVHGVLKDLQQKELYLTMDAHLKDLSKFCTRAICIGAIMMTCNVALAPIFLFWEGAGASKATRQIYCFPVNDETTACNVLVVFGMVTTIMYSAYWIFTTIAFMAVCHVFREAFLALARELPGRLHWARTNPQSCDPKDVVSTAMIRHQALNDQVAMAAKLWNLWISAALCTDIPLVVFILYQIINMLNGKTEFSTVFFITCIFWAFTGVVHVMAIALSASRVMVSAHSIAHMLLAPRMHELLGSSTELQAMILVFNKYVDEEPTCFRILHLKLTNEVVGTLFSLIMGYVIVMATL